MSDENAKETTGNGSGASICYAVIDGVLLNGRVSAIGGGGWMTITDQNGSEHKGQSITWRESQAEACLSRLAWLFSWKGRKAMPDILERADYVCKVASIIEDHTTRGANSA